MFLYFAVEAVPADKPEAREYISRNLKLDTKPQEDTTNPGLITAWRRRRKKEAIDAMMEDASHDGAYGEALFIAVAKDASATSVFGPPTRPASAFGPSRPSKPRVFDSEGKRISSFFHDYDAAASSLCATPVAYDIARFSRRFLLQRAAALSVPVPRSFRLGVAEDPMELWAGPREHVPEEELAMALGIPLRDPRPGVTTAHLFAQRDLEGIEDRCVCRVEWLREVHRRLRPGDES